MPSPATASAWRCSIGAGCIRAPGIDLSCLVGFTRAELEAARDVTGPDLLGSETRLVFVGINPEGWTAAPQAHFAGGAPWGDGL